MPSPQSYHAAVLFAVTLVLVPVAGIAQTMSVTIDDLPGRPHTGDCDAASAIEMNQRILTALGEAEAPATGFVTASTVCPSKRDSVLRVVSADWLGGGHTLGNHTFSHPDLNTTPVDEFKDDILRGGEALNRAIGARNHPERYFRYPMLHTGDTPAKKDEIASFLAGHGYVDAPVSIDSQEWLFANAYRNAVAQNDLEVATCIGEAYVPFMLSVLTFFEDRSAELLGRNPAHILLLHANELNAAYLPDLLDAMAARGYRFVTLSEALADPLYSEDDGYVGRRGLSSIHRWAVAHGEDVVEEPREPDWIHNPSSHCLNNP